ncbi:MAG: hypothetical protein HC817_01680 [Saprospiraceae bacterium]|nr:hypothetical protein [Saprospiraceae bacterium]
MTIAFGFLEKARAANQFTEGAFEKVYSMDFLLNTFILRVKCLMKELAANPQRNDIFQQIKNELKQAQLAIAFQRQNLKEVSSKDFLSDVILPIYEFSIRFNTSDKNRFNNEEAFNAAELSKSLSLLESIKNTDALKIRGIPDSLLQQELELRLNITDVEKSRFLELSKGKQANDTILNAFGSRLFDLRQKEENVKKYSKTYPLSIIKPNMTFRRFPSKLCKILCYRPLKVCWNISWAIAISIFLWSDSAILMSLKSKKIFPSKR